MFNIKFNKWTTQQKLIGLIVLAFCLCWFLQSGTIEKFVDGGFSRCPNRLYYSKDHKKYYLINTSHPLEKGKNPLVYDTLDDYYKNAPKECPKLKVIKKGEPVLPLQHKCNRKRALEDARYNDCSYGVHTRFNEKDCEEAKALEKEIDNHTNISIDRCMMDQIIKNDTKLNPFRSQLYRTQKHSKL